MDKWIKTIKGNRSKSTSSETSETTVESVTNTSRFSLHLANKETAEASKKRKYDDSYLSYGSTWIGNEERPNGLCVECGTVISNTSLFPAKLKRHLEKKHSQLKNKDINYFRNIYQKLKEKI